MLAVKYILQYIYCNIYITLLSTQGCVHGVNVCDAVVYLFDSGGTT